MKLIKIDLHNTRHADVKSLLIRRIEDIWDSDSDVHIITGHSDRMKDIVIEVLNEYKLEYRVGDILGINTGFIKTSI